MTTTFTSTDPRDGTEFARHAGLDADGLEHRLARAAGVSDDLARTPIHQRATWLFAAATELERRRDDLAALMVREMGKPIDQARSEVDKCAWACRYFARNAEGHLAPDVINTDARTAMVRHDPLGPLLAIMPWNFPLWQLFRVAAPNIAAGNPILLKHASNVPGSALAIEEVWTDAGVPEGVFSTLLIPSDAVADVIADRRVRAVTLTGSVPAGRSVAATAGEHLKPTVLELGGSDAFVVLGDADLEAAAKTAVDSRMLNNGQSCIAAKRFIVVASVADAFTELVAEEIRSRVVGDPMDEGTDIGPMAQVSLRDELDEQVAASIEDGARVVIRGGRVDQPGAWFAPTLLTDVDPQMTSGREELFGPAASILPVPTVEAALAVANASDFGLGASLWTADLELARTLAPRIEAGGVFVNELVKSDPRVPFGGVKDSGYGRELGALGARQFTNAKTVWIA